MLEITLKYITRDLIWKLWDLIKIIWKIKYIVSNRKERGEKNVPGGNYQDFLKLEGGGEGGGITASGNILASGKFQSV